MSGRKWFILGGVVAVALVVAAVFVLVPGDEGTNELAADVEERGENSDTRGRDTEEPPTSMGEPEDLCPTAGEVQDRDSLPEPDTSAKPLDLQIDRAGRGTEYPFSFGADEGWPYQGELFVDVLPGTYTDVPVHLETGPQAVIFAANDCIKGSVEIYSPSGELVGSADDLGEPGVVEGWEFTGGDEVTVAGTYVFRVIQDTGTDDGGFVLRFYAP